jgi:hypothetical protein
MARIETSNFSHPNLASSINSRNQTNSTKDRNDIVKNEFTVREGTYKISALVDNLSKIGTNICLNEPVKITLLTRLQTIIDSNSSTSSRRSSTTNNNHQSILPNLDNEHFSDGRRSSTSENGGINKQNGNIVITEILAFNVGRELIIYEFSEATQV